VNSLKTWTDSAGPSSTRSDSSPGASPAVTILVTLRPSSPEADGGAKTGGVHGKTKSCVEGVKDLRCVPRRVHRQRWAVPTGRSAAAGPAGPTGRGIGNGTLSVEPGAAGSVSVQTETLPRGDASLHSVDAVLT